MKVPSLKGSLSWALPARLFAVGVKAIAIILLARLLGPEAFGVFVFVLSVVATFVLFADLGLSPATARLLAEMEEPSLVPVRKAASILTLIALGIAGAYLLVSDVMASITGAPQVHELRWPILLLFFGQLSTRFCSKTYEGFRRIDVSSKIKIAFEWSSWGLALFLVLIGPRVAGSAVLGKALGSLLVATSLVLGIVHLSRKGLVSCRWGESVTRRRLARYAIPMALTAAGFYIYTHSDVLLVQYFLGSREVGIYGTAVRLLDMLHVPAAAVGSATAAFFVSRKRASLQDAQDLFHKTTRGLLAFFVPAAVGLALLADEILVLVFGGEYAAGGLVLTLYSPFLVLKALSGTYSLALDYLGYATHRAIASLSSALANLGLNVVLIPRFGIEGAAIATLVTYVPLMVWYVLLLQRDLHITGASVTEYLPAITGSSLVMGIVVYASSALWALHVSVLIGVGIVTFAGASLMTGVWSMRDLERALTRLE